MTKGKQTISKGILIKQSGTTLKLSHKLIFASENSAAGYPVVLISNWQTTGKLTRSGCPMIFTVMVHATFFILNLSFKLILNLSCAQC